MFWIYLLFISPLAFADTKVELAPLIKEGTPGELLLADPIVPAEEGRTGRSSANGSIQNSLENQLATPIIDYGQPGGPAQVKGFGVSAEEVDVQAFGISLNPPQGGGFDLSAFPQFLWSHYSFQIGPSLNGINQTSNSGTLSLTPWTAVALSSPKSCIRGTAFSSSLGVNQISAAAQSEGNLAVVAGYSMNQVTGPSGGFSNKWKRGGYSGRMHLLFTHLDVSTPGSSDLPTPRARTQKVRGIPLLQSDFQLTNDSSLKTSAFYDWGQLNYSDPDSNFNFESTIKQWGFESAYLLKDWTFGINFRQVSYSRNDGTSLITPIQNFSNILASKVVSAGPFLLEPRIQGVWINGYGLLPQGSIGARLEWNQGHESLFSRVTYSNRFPTLLDRFSVGTTFTGNPNLVTESDWTGIVGTEWKQHNTELTLQSYVQLRQDARVPLGMTVTNLGNGYLLALTGTGKLTLSHTFEIYSSLSLSKSKLFVTDSEFPYSPYLMNSTGFSLHSDSQGNRMWEWLTSIRSSSSQSKDIYNLKQAGGYFVIDTEAKFALGKQISINGRIENIFGRPVEIITGYPLGRNFSIIATGEL